MKRKKIKREGVGVWEGVGGWNGTEGGARMSGGRGVCKVVLVAPTRGGDID